MRALGAYELKAPVKFSQEQIYKQIKEEYSRRLSSNGIKTDPNTIPHDAWIDDVKQWPEVERPESLLVLDDWLCGHSLVYKMPN